MAKTMLGQALSCAVVGSPETVRQGIDAFVRRTGADELMVTSQMVAPKARLRSPSSRCSAAEKPPQSTVSVVTS